MKYKSAVTVLMSNFRKSGQNSTGTEMEDEIYNNFLGNGSSKDLLLFYCWKEWNTFFPIHGWLLRSSESSSPSSTLESSSSSPPSESSSKKRKRNGEEQLIPKEVITQLQEAFTNEALENSIIERNRFEIAKLQRDDLTDKMNRLEVFIENKSNIFTEEQVIEYKKKYAEYANEMLSR